jgi:hypothetical protein
MNTYSKLNGQWAIRSANPALAGQTVTVTKRDGASKQVLLGAKVGEGFGDTYYAIAERPQPAGQVVGDLSALIAMFDRARRHLRFPKIVMDGFRVGVAGPRAKQPGSLTITAAEKNDQGERAWFGRVTLAGEFQPARDVPNTAAIGDKLRALAADPARVAAEHGRLHGACCFCNIPLRDERSTAMGYGPDCADNFGLPWGARAARQEAPPTALRVSYASTPVSHVVYPSRIDQ